MTDWRSFTKQYRASPMLPSGMSYANRDWVSGQTNRTRVEKWDSRSSSLQGEDSDCLLVETIGLGHLPAHGLDHAAHRRVVFKYP